MRITCFVLGVLCLLGSGAWLVLGTVNFEDTRTSTSTTAPGLRMQAVDSSPNLDDFGPASTLAEVFALAGVAWMVGAAAFAPKQAAPAPGVQAGPGAPQQWQAPQFGPPPGGGQQFPPSTPFPQQGPGQPGSQQPPQGQPPQG